MDAGRVAETKAAARLRVRGLTWMSRRTYRKPPRYRSLRTDPIYRRSIIFMLTTSSNHVDKITAYDFNIAGYVLKEKAEKSFSEFIEFLKLYIEFIELL